MEIEQLLKYDVFKNMEEERLDAIKKLLAQARGKSATEVMFIAIKYSKGLNAGRQISKEERAEVVNAICSELSAKDKEDFKGVIKAIEMLG